MIQIIYLRIILSKTLIYFKIISIYKVKNYSCNLGVVTVRSEANTNPLDYKFSKNHHNILTFKYNQSITLPLSQFLGTLPGGSEENGVEIFSMSN